MTSVTAYHYKALRFIGLAGKTEQAVADEYGSRRPLEIDELTAAGLVCEASVPLRSGEAAGEVVVYFLTRAGVEAAGLDADATGKQ